MTLKENYNTDALTSGLKEMNIEVSDKQISQLLRYYEMLVEWNEVMNLTAITEYEEVIVKHFLDSVSLVKIMEPKTDTLIDVGCGAGFPGLPLKIVFPELKVTLLDSLNKRVKFLQAVIDELSLDGVAAVHGRAEDFAHNKDYRERYDICVSRAVANLSTLSEYCLPFVKRGGSFVAYKAEKGAEELSNASKAIKLLGGEVILEQTFMLPGTDLSRVLYQIRKVDGTPGKYPRKAGLPSKEPIQ